MFYYVPCPRNDVLMMMMMMMMMMIVVANQHIPTSQNPTMVVF